ncbi:MAG: hypothetical protein ACJ74W_22950 [Pyrinomonadaceae bacterium]
MRNLFGVIVLAALTLTIRNSAQAQAIGNTAVTPDATQAGVPVRATVTASITDPALIPESVNLQRLDASGRVVAILGTLHDDGLNFDAMAGDQIYSLSTTIFENTPNAVRLRISAAFRGSLLRVYSAPLTVNITGTATGVTIGAPSNAAYLNISPVTVSGTVGDPAAQVTVNGVNAPVSGGNFVATVPLNEGPNTLTAVATNSNGTTSTTSTLVTLDTTPPHVAIYSPTNDMVTTDATTTVTGLVNDIVVGTVNPQQATVTVNGVAAEVINRTFTATNIPLALGANSIQVTGVDRAGNGATATITITRQALTQTTLRVSAGNGQAGPIGGLLPAPLVAQLLNGAGQPMPNTPVVFRVTSQDGTLSLDGNAGTGMNSIAVNTDAQGLAAVKLTLGSRAGAGNNMVEASTTGVASTAVFTASATSATPGLIIVDTGNSQSGVIGQPLALPFIAVVTDTGYNRLAGVPVTFTVKQGGASFAGQPTFEATSDSDGRVLATLTLGPEPGVSNNVVEASFAGNSGAPVAFTASALAPGPANATRISGVVLDNSNNPIPGVTMRLFQINQGNNGNVPQQVVTSVLTDAQGQFIIPSAPVGIFKLMADGGTAQRPGSWPTLEYDIVTVTGQNNNVGLPIYLPELLANNRLCVSPTTGGTLTIPQAPGFSLTIAPGSATFPGGSRTGCVSVTPVNMDKVPMAPGFGQQPRFVVTIQPVGTTFNQPAAITIPNVDGLAPRAVTEMYSYDHDLAAFVAIGTGTVSDDGSVIRSDPGVGVLKAGWHCGGNPNQTGSAGKCPDCQKCQGSGCQADSTKNGQHCSTQDVPNGTCLEGTCLRLMADVLVNNTATNSDDITVLNPVQTIPARITLHGGDGHVELTISPAGRATLDKTSLDLTDGQSDTVTITPTGRSQSANDVIITARADGKDIGRGKLTVAAVTIPSIRATNTPTGVPNRIPPRVDSQFQVTVLPDLGSSGQVVTLATLNTSATNGDFTIEGSATKDITKTITVKLKGTVQTAATSAPGGGNAGNLKLVAKVRGASAVQSAGFSVAAIPQNYTEALVGPVTRPGVYGLIVQDGWESDSGVINDLDQVDLSEQVQVDTEHGSLVGLGGGQNSSYLPATQFTTDTHSTGAARVTGVGDQRVSQTNIFRDRRTGVVDIPMTNSGYFIDRNAFIDAVTSVLRFMTSKIGAATTANGFASGAGQPRRALSVTQP